MCTPDLVVAWRRKRRGRKERQGLRKGGRREKEKQNGKNGTFMGRTPYVPAVHPLLKPEDQPLFAPRWWRDWSAGWWLKRALRSLCDDSPFPFRVTVLPWPLLPNPKPEVPDGGETIARGEWENHEKGGAVRSGFQLGKLWGADTTLYWWHSWGPKIRKLEKEFGSLNCWLWPYNTPQTCSHWWTCLEFSERALSY